MGKQWTEKYLVCTIINFIDRYGCLPNESDFCEKNDLLGIEIYHKIFDMSLNEIFITHSEFEKEKRKMLLENLKLYKRYKQ